MTEKLSIDQVLLQKLNSIIETNLENEKFGVSELATEIGLSRSQLHRRLQDINGKSTSQFIREYRLEKAMEMLKRNEATASEIAYRVGFSSPTYFNTCFHNFYGYPPGEVKFQKAITPPKKNFAKKVLSIVPVIILLGLLVFNKTFNKDKIDASNIEKTIAVLPFINESNNEENMYFCNGIMAGIRDQLAKIPEFYVVSRLSVEKYRNTASPIKNIARELDVNYVIEGHVQRIGNRAIISAELIQVNDNKVLWSERYDKDVSEVFDVQANVIQSITSNLETIISPNLKTELNTIPTQDTLAYVHYLKGEEYRYKADIRKQEHKVWLNLITKAKSSYALAIKSDSLYSSAYIGLAQTAFERYTPYSDDENNLDEVLTLTNKAIQLNPNASLAYLIRGDYYERINALDKAIKEYEKSLEIIPNNGKALYRLVYLFQRKFDYKNVVITLKQLEKYAISRDDLIRLYQTYQYYYRALEKNNMVDYCFNEIFKLQVTPAFNYARYLSFYDTNQLNESLIYVKKFLVEDNMERNLILGYLYYRKKDFPKALEYYTKCYQQVEESGINNYELYGEYGAVLMQMGQIEKGRKMLRKQISINNDLINSKRHDNDITYIRLAIIHAWLGEFDQAHAYIKKFDDVNGWLYYLTMYSWVKNDFSFDVLREDPVFKASYKKAGKQMEDIQNQIRPYLPATPPIKQY